MRRLSRRSLTFLLSSTLALPFAAACGDDDGGGSDDADAAPGDPDANDTDAAPPPEVVRSGTLAITETSVTNFGGAVFGAVNVISFTDETTRTTPPVEGFESPLTGAMCAIFVYDVGEDETPDLVDEGNITVTGTPHGPFVCKSSALAPTPGEYVCQSADATTRGGVPGNAVGATLSGAANTLTLPIGTNADDTWIGMQIALVGFEDFPDGTMFPIVDVVDGGDAADTLQLSGVPDGDGPVVGEGTDTYSTFVGAGPIPGGFDFLGDGEIDISKEAGDVIPLLERSATAAGDGTADTKFQLVDDPENDFYMPHEIPTDEAVDVSFHCEECGSDGDTPQSAGLVALTISGRTTDGVVGEDPTEMPDPVTQYAMFQCSNIADGADTVSIPSEAMEIILGTNPTRIQTSVGRAAGYAISEQVDEGYWGTNVIVGHTHLGYTTVGVVK